MTISISWCCRAESDFNAFYTVQSYFWFSLAQIQIISYFVRITKEQKWDMFSLTKIKISSVTAWLSNDASIRNVEVLLFPLVTAQVRKTRQVWNQLLPCCVVYVWTLRALLQYGLTWSLCQLSAPHSPASSLVSGAERKKNLIWGENSCFAHRIRFISSRNSRESSRMDSLLQVLSGLCIKVTCSARSHIHCLKLSFLVSCWPLSVVVSDQWILYWFLFTSMKKLKL